MDDMIQGLIEFVAGIWRKDSELRDNSLLGESEIEKRDRKGVAWVCGGAIVLLAVAGFGFWWWLQNRQ